MGVTANIVQRSKLCKSHEFIPAVTGRGDGNNISTFIYGPGTDERVSRYYLKRYRALRKRYDKA